MIRLTRDIALLLISGSGSMSSGLTEGRTCTGIGIKKQTYTQTKID
jgi:hypothetical protein